MGAFCRVMKETTATITFESTSPDETRRLGRVLGSVAKPGDVFALIGTLGAGKTELVKGVASGLGVADESGVNSPTFVLVNEYDGRLHVYHVDAYRLGGTTELKVIGFEEICQSGGLVVVEWADRVESLIPSRALWTAIEVTGDRTRRMVLTGPFDEVKRIESGLSTPAE